MTGDARLGSDIIAPGVIGWHMFPANGPYATAVIKDSARMLKYDGPLAVVKRRGFLWTVTTVQISGYYGRRQVIVQ